MSLRFNRLTRPAVRALPLKGKITEHGITAERMLTGDCRYSINIMADGQRIHRVIGRESEGVTREQAERTIEVLRTRAREERLDLPTGRKTPRTFEEAAIEYLKRLEETLGEGQKGYRDLPNKRRNLNSYLVPYFGKHRADKISSFLVRHYQRKRIDEGAKLASVNRELSTLSHMLRTIAGWKWIKASDCPEINKDEEPRKKIVVLSDDNAEALFKGAVGDQDAATWLFVAIGLNTAMRHSEILRIRWSDVDIERRRIYIPAAKAGQRVQPITVALAEVLERERSNLPEERDYLFPSRRAGTKTPYRRDMDRQFHRAVIRAKLDPAKVTPHVMRHTGITKLVEAGIDLPTIQKISGHKTLAMVMRYVHLSDHHIDRSIEAIGTNFFDSITPELHRGAEMGEARKPHLRPAKP